MLLRDVQYTESAIIVLKRVEVDSKNPVNPVGSWYLCVVCRTGIEPVTLGTEALQLVNSTINWDHVEKYEIELHR